MKQTTLLNLLAASGLLLVGGAQADDPPKRPLLRAAGGAGGVIVARENLPVQYYGRQLSLSVEQQKVWTEIQTDQRAKTREIFSNKDLTAGQKREKYQAAQKNLEKKLLEVLTGEQKKKLGELKKDFAERKGQFNPNKWMDDIGMSKEQKEKWTTVTKARSAAYSEISKKAKELTREERTAAYQKIAKEFNAKFDAILTDEQKEKRAKLNRQPGGQGGVVIRNPQDQLGLTDEQKKKLNELTAERTKKIREIYSDKNLSRQEKAAAASKVYQEIRKKTNGIYKPKQLKQLQQRRGGGGFGALGSGGIRVLPRPRKNDK